MLKNFLKEVQESNKKEADSAANKWKEKSKEVLDVKNDSVSINKTELERLGKEEKFNASRGHGFAAERANTLYDKLLGKNAEITGDDNVKDGADRLVNGEWIQSKYCNTGSNCISACFRDGKFRYFDSEGNPMKIEVPSDKYDDAVRAMQKRIASGQVEGVTDPQKATDIVKKGYFSYGEAQDIAKAGTVESIKYDAVNSAINNANSLGTTALVTFAKAIWNGKPVNEAAKEAAYMGLRTYGKSFVTSTLSGQLNKSVVQTLLKEPSKELVSILGPKGASMLANVFNTGTPIYGAAASQAAAKLLRGNALTGAATFAVSLVPNFIDVFTNKITPAQFFKNTIKDGVSIASGMAGSMAAGAAAGSVFGPVGTVVGGLAGSLAGSNLGGKAVEGVSSVFREDDAKTMTDIIGNKFEELATKYGLTGEEAEIVADRLSEKLDENTLKDMCAAENKEEFAANLLESDIKDVISERSFISLPTVDTMITGLANILADIYDEITKSDNIKEVVSDINQKRKDDF